jgi:predicted hydrocarbon binding protein/KaiC/GvpD/RAD55 family RecA-like ATPase
MQQKGLSLADIQQVPRESLILLTGPPGAGKSTFCHQVVLNGIAIDRPVIFVTTEQRPRQVISLLRDRGLGEPTAGALSFVDAYSQTVGVESPERPDTIYANCMDLNSISIAITKLQERMGRSGILLALDSLSSPYLLSGAEVIRFMRLFLSKFAAEGNSVMASMDEGCGKCEDLVAMMSIADGVIKMEMEEDKRLLNVVKHPRVRPARIEVPMAPSIGIEAYVPDPSMTRQFVQAMLRGEEAWMRRELGDFVNLFWPNLAHWSGMLWDPKRFPMMTYELNKEDPRYMMRESKASFPWQMRLLLMIAPKNFSKVKEIRKASKLGIPYIKMAHFERSGVVEYLEDVSKTDEHYFRVHESSDCWGFENVGAPMASHLPPLFAGSYRGVESEERNWNAVETKCIGLGDPCCEFKVVPGEIDELRDSLEKDASVIKRIHDRLMGRLLGFLLDGKPLVERARLGSNVQLHAVWHAMGSALSSERYRMAQRMGGAKAGKEVGERLMDAGLDEDEAIRRVIDFMRYCKVGKIALGETIRVEGNCESLCMEFFTPKPEEPCCFFTTGFLNGLFSAVKNQHIREIRCIGAGDPYCEWEIK